MKRIGILTSGGDSPGMNAALRSAVRTALSKGVSVVGFYAGYEGLINADTVMMTSQTVSGIINRGGTILRSARSKKFATAEGMETAYNNAKEMGIEGLIVIGGNGSLTGAEAISNKYGLPVVGAPGTIDNDLAGTDYTIGFDTAVNTALWSIDKIRDTAYSHDRLFVVEVMGRDSGFLALEVGLAGGAEGILIPEIPNSLDEITERLMTGGKRGKKSSIIILAEGYGKAHEIAEKLQNATGNEARYVVLGHMQRGGAPTAFDCVLSTRLGAYAAEQLLSGADKVMVGVEGNEPCTVPLDIAIRQKKPLDANKLALGKLLGL